MLAKTVRNRFYLVLVNITITYLSHATFFLGLLPIWPINDFEAVINTRLLSAYCSLWALLIPGLFLCVTFSVAHDEHINSFFAGVGKITWNLLNLCSLVLIIAFYLIAFLNRFRLRDFYNKIIGKYKTYRGFYGGTFRLGYLSFEHVEGEDELSFVYLRSFVKVILVHSLVILSIIGVSERGWTLGGVAFLKFFGFFFIPYYLSSLTTSILYLSGARSSFMYHKLDIKLQEILEDLRQLTRSDKSQFERMSRYCEMSDQLDNLAECYESVNETTTELIGLYKIQMLLVLMYNIIDTLHGMFTQYQVLAIAMELSIAPDPMLVCFNILFIFLTIVEILLVVNITDSCHRGSIRVGKTIQKLAYFEDLDIRLQQSVRDWIAILPERISNVTLFLYFAD